MLTDADLDARLAALSDADVAALAADDDNPVAWEFVWRRSHAVRVALAREVVRLRAEVAEQRAANLKLAERLAACSQVLSRAAERRPDLAPPEG